MLGEGERIALRGGEGVVRVAAHAHRGDGVAGDAADADVRGGVGAFVEPGIVEAAAEQRRRVVAAGADAGRGEVAVAFEQLAPGVAHGERVRRIVEGGEAVGAVPPAGVGVGMAVGAVLLAQQMLHDVVADGAGEGRRVGLLGALRLPRLGQKHGGRA